MTKKWQKGGNNFWGLPGREISFGETIKDCAGRYLFEEIGMKITDCRIICVNANFGFGNHYITIGILAKAKGSPFNKKSDDWNEWKYFKKEHFPKKLFPSAELTIKSFLEEKISIE